MLPETNLPCYVIGGYVRDLLLKRPSKDIDIVVVGSGIDLAKAVAKKIGKKGQDQVFTAILEPPCCGMMIWKLNLLVPVRNRTSADSRNPSVEDGTLEDDQNRRDFTINAMAISLNRETYGELLDPFNGLHDLKAKIIRTPLDPDITYSDDPLRMMRAIRFSAQLGFHNRGAVTAGHQAQPGTNRDHFQGADY